MKVVSRGIVGSDLCFGKITMAGCKEAGKRKANRAVRDEYRDPGLQGSEF